MYFGLLIYFFSIFSDAGWNTQDRADYDQRRFLDLLSRPHIRKHPHLVEALLMQQKDLGACRAIHEGHGGLDGVVGCMRFINTEVELGLKSPGRDALVQELNELCERLVTPHGELKKVMKSEVLKTKHPLWQKCTRMVWRQVFLTATANFEAQPQEVYTLIRNAKATIATDNHWKNQTLIRFEMR